MNDLKVSCEAPHQKVSLKAYMMLRSTCQSLKCTIANVRFLKGKKSGDGTKCNKKGHSSLSLSLSHTLKTTCKIPKSPMIVNLVTWHAITYDAEEDK
jgi:hypothetical protein